ncbi:MAG: hypothetical protein HY966_01650 [Ignavibacteriales bacterium]|nr:hypothetical protein [Ignavibacteriales bacterium]
MNLKHPESGRHLSTRDMRLGACSVVYDNNYANQNGTDQYRSEAHRRKIPKEMTGGDDDAQLGLPELRIQSA